MIERYSRPEMARIWTDANRFSIWLQIEVAAAEAMALRQEIPSEAVKEIKEKTDALVIDETFVSRVLEIEATVKHDVIAFLTAVTEQIGPVGRYLHMGMTSSDVLDTCLAVQLTQATDILLEDLKVLLESIHKRAVEHRMTPMIGRSHGIHAEPITFGLKLASWYAEMDRNRERLLHARKEIAVGAVSGAVGTFANIDPAIELFVCEKLGLDFEPVSTQVIPRDRHAVFFSTLAVIGASMERIAVEVRHLQRTEVLEAEEFFSAGQKGSSAMPHKRNPILTENLTGMARLLRGYAVPALENVALWHERDISHSSVERMIGPDATVILNFALRRLEGVVRNLVVYADNMAANLDRLHGLVHSQRVLLALVDKGLTREGAYAAVQRNAMKVWEKGADFRVELAQDEEVAGLLSEADLAGLFDLAYHTKHVDTIFGRVFRKDPERSDEDV